MQLHIHATKQGDVIKTVLIDNALIYETDKKVAWEGEYVKLLDKVYLLVWANYIDYKVTDQFIYNLVEVKPIRDLNFMLDIQ